MTALELKLLGDVEVFRDGQAQALPPSKKTRALLAYVALRESLSRRDHLCELPDYSWLHVPVLDRRGRIRHDGGVVDAPGMYVLGLPYLRRRKSSFIHGAEDDTRELGAHLAHHLDRLCSGPMASVGG